MKKKINLVSSIIMYVVAILILLFYAISSFKIEMVEFLRLILLCTSCLFLYFGGLLLSKYLGNNKPMKINLYIFFILYLILLITLTLFDSSWGRNGFAIKDFKVYIKQSVNLVPFKTIINYIKEFNSMYSTRQIMFNLLGNICAFMPMALFLPLLFKKQSKFKNFIITMIIIILGIESLQLITTSGRFDIDDLILNLFGAAIMYLLLNIKSVNDLINNMFLLEHNKISKKSYIKIISFILIIIIVCLSIIVYRNKLYNQNVDDYNSINNPNITFEHDNNCGDNNSFYEDEIYKYYFKCYDNSYFYVVVNDKDKFSVKDFLNNSKYNYDIERLLYNMNDNNINYEIEHKYTYFNIEIENPNNDSSSFTDYVDSDIAKLVIIDKSNKDKVLDYEVNIIPIKNGTKTMNINIELTDGNGKTKTITKKINVNVDENLNVSYKEE